MKQIQAGKPVRGKQFVGRKDEILTISELLLQGQSVVLIAPRRFGKTSLVLEILDRLKRRDFYTAFIDVFLSPDLTSVSHKITEEVLQNRKLGKVFKKISGDIGEIFRNIELKQTIESFEFLLKYSTPEPNIWELFSESIDFINNYPAKYDRRIICAFDEFGDIRKYDGDHIVKMIRSKIQMQKHATYFFSGSYESVMENLFVKKNSPFFRFARIIPLGYIDRQDFKTYITGIFREYNITYHENQIDRILDFTKGHPYYTKLIIQQLLLNKSVGRVTEDFSLKDLLKQLLIIENNYLEKQWEDISKSNEQVRAIMAVVKYRKSLYSHIDTRKVNLGRALKRLTGTGILIKGKDHYYLADPLFEFWIKEKIINS
ncbi:MAG: ATP-binding protein [Chlorobi bacterium]|nr:ATP-binding protein [Chlorobiota bacterium]